MNTTSHERDTCATPLTAEDLAEAQGGLPGLGSLMALLKITCATVPKACRSRED